MKSGFWHGVRDFLSDNNGTVLQMPRECCRLDPSVPGHGLRPDEAMMEMEKVVAYRKVTKLPQATEIEERLIKLKRTGWLTFQIQQCVRYGELPPENLNPEERVWFSRTLEIERLAHHERKKKAAEANERKRLEQQRENAEYKRATEKRHQEQQRELREQAKPRPPHAPDACRPWIQGSGALLPDDHPQVMAIYKVFDEAPRPERIAFHAFYCERRAVADEDQRLANHLCHRMATALRPLRGY